MLPSAPVIKNFKTNILVESASVTPFKLASFQENDANPLAEKSSINTSILRVYPNPTRGIIIVDVFSLKQEISNLFVYDEDGRQLYLTSFNLNTGLNQIKVDLGGSLYVRNKYYLIKIIVNGKPVVYKILLL